MTSSVNEIGRQVQESSRIAGEAVTQAQKTDARIGELSQAAQPHRRRRQAHHRDRRADQPARAQRHHRGGARRRGRQGLRGRRPGGQGARRPDRQGDRRDRHPDRRHADGDRRIRSPPSRRSAPPSAASPRSPSTIAAAVEEQGAATAGDRPQRPAGRAGHHPGRRQHRRRQPGRGETGSASAQVLSSARALSSEGAKLKTEVDKFLATVRAA